MSGVNSHVGTRAASAWDETPPAAATDYLPIRSEGITKQFAKYNSEVLGSPAMPRSFNGHRMVRGPVVCPLDAQDSLRMLEYGLGSVRTNVLDYFEVANTLPIFHMNIDRDGTVYQAAACMVDSIAIRHQLDQMATLEMQLVANGLTRTGDSPSSLAPAADPGEFTWGALSVRVGDLANQLVPEDEVDVRSLEISVNNRLAQDAGSKSSGIILPERGGHREVRVTLEFPKQSAESRQFESWKDANTPIQINATWATSNGTVTVGLFYGFVVDGADHNVSGPGRLNARAVIDVTQGANTLGVFTSVQGEQIFASRI